MREAVHTEQLWFRASPGLAEMVKERARQEDKSPSEYLREIVRRNVRETA